MGWANFFPNLRFWSKEIIRIPLKKDRSSSRSLLWLGAGYFKGPLFQAAS